MKKEDKIKFLNNLIKFTAPGLAAFFGQLALGAELKVAAITGMLVLYGALADLFNKLK